MPHRASEGDSKPSLAIVLVEKCLAFSVSSMARYVQLGNERVSKTLDAAPELLITYDFVCDPDKSVVISDEGLPLQATAHFSDKKYDCVFLPIIVYEPFEATVEILESNPKLLEWLRYQWNSGATIATTHTGIFLLAETGLLDGKKTPIPFRPLERAFKRRYPKVSLDRTSPIIETERMIRVTSGAATFGLHLRVLKHLAGPAAAVALARGVTNRLGHNEDSRYVLFYLDAFESNRVFDKAVHWMRSRIGEDVRLSDLASALSVSERTLIRHFKAATGTTPIEYLRQMRLSLAKTLLEETTLQLGEVAEAAGYKEYTSFARAFYRRFGMSPMKMRYSGSSLEGSEHEYDYIL